MCEQNTEKEKQLCTKTKTNKKKKKPNQKPEINLPSVTNEIQTVCNKC